MSSTGTKVDAQRCITLAVAGYENRELRGMIYHDSMKGRVDFHSLIQMIFIIESILTGNQYPVKTMEHRKFETLQESDQMIDSYSMNIIPVENAENLHGVLATIQLQVDYRYNATWQGKMIWSGKEEPVVFGSFLEFLKILDRELGDEMALNKESDADNGEDFSMKGILYHSSLIQGVEFYNAMDVMRFISHSLESINESQDSNLERSFQMKQKYTLEVNRARGRRLTFIVHILFNDNATWQGTAVLKETGEKVNFRSYLELVMMISMHPRMIGRLNRNEQ